MNSASIGRRLLDGWMAIVARFGQVQTLAILTLFYAFLIGPVSLVSKLGRADMLGKRGLGEEGTAWLDADSASPDLERAKLAS